MMRIKGARYGRLRKHLKHWLKRHLPRPNNGVNFQFAF